MKFPGIYLSSTVLIATAVLGMNNFAYGQCRGDWCPIPNSYYDQNAPSQYGYDANSRPQYEQNPNWRNNPYWQGNQNPNWQGNQNPDWRNDIGWRNNGSQNMQSSSQAWNQPSQNLNQTSNWNNNSNWQNNNPNQQSTNQWDRSSNPIADQHSYVQNKNGKTMYFANVDTDASGHAPIPGSDTLLQQKIDDALKNNYLKKNYKQVNARVYNGSVTLTGSVETEQDRQDVEKRVHEVSGVRNVNDQLKVTSTSDIGYNDNDATTSTDEQTSTDMDLQKQAEDTLKNNYIKKNYDMVVVTVSRGVVTITGPVDSDKDRQEILTRLGKIKGIANINDRLQVSGDAKTSYNSSKPAYAR